MNVLAENAGAPLLDASVVLVARFPELASGQDSWRCPRFHWNIRRVVSSFKTSQSRPTEQLPLSRRDVDVTARTTGFADDEARGPRNAREAFDLGAGRQDLLREALRQVEQHRAIVALDE